MGLNRDYVEKEAVYRLWFSGSLSVAWWGSLLYGDTVQGILPGLVALKSPGSGWAALFLLLPCLILLAWWTHPLVWAGRSLVIWGSGFLWVVILGAAFSPASRLTPLALTAAAMAASGFALTGWGRYLADTVPVAEMFRAVTTTVCTGIFLFYCLEGLDLFSSHWGTKPFVLILPGAASASVLRLKTPLKRPVFGISPDPCISFLLPAFVFCVCLSIVPPKGEGMSGTGMVVCLLLAVLVRGMVKRPPVDVVLNFGLAGVCAGLLLKDLGPAWGMLFCRVAAAAGWTVLCAGTWTLAVETGYMYGRPALVLGRCLAAGPAALMVNAFVGPQYGLGILGPLAGFCMVPFIFRRYRAGLREIASSRSVRTALKSVILDQHVQDLLTPKEKEIYRFMCLGYKNLDIAAQEGISINTLKGHARSIYKKLGVKNKKELLAGLDRESPS